MIPEWPTRGIAFAGRAVSRIDLERQDQRDSPSAALLGCARIDNQHRVQLKGNSASLRLARHARGNLGRDIRSDPLREDSPRRSHQLARIKLVLRWQLTGQLEIQNL